MDELALDNKKYLSSKRAAQVTGYAKDYVGQLCREGRVQARLVGRNWYVLESSILEHRFGAEESDNEPVNAAPEKAPVSTWNPPVYTAETAAVVPTIAPKPAPAPVEAPISGVDSTKVLADMRSAWQEWFEQQQESEPLLPDASEMLLEEGHDEEEPEVEKENVPLTKIEEITEESSAEDNFPVHIARIQPQVREEEPSVPSPELYHEPVAVSRKYVDLAASTTRSEVIKKHSRATRRTVSPRTKGNAVYRAVMLSVAGLAIAIAVVGSGAADSFIGHNSYFTTVTDFVSGVHTFNAR
ncbi:MAG: hypothetical protein ACM3TU_03960 [Bacillota bacterium]